MVVDESLLTGESVGISKDTTKAGVFRNVQVTAVAGLKGDKA